MNISPIRKRPKKTAGTPNIDYYPEVDPFEDMDVERLFDEPVLPQNDKQIVPKPRSYEETFPEFYVDPQYFPEQPNKLPPEYDEDEVPDYEIDDEDTQKDILNKLNIQDHENVEKILNQEIMNSERTRRYLRDIIKKAYFRRNELKVVLSSGTHAGPKIPNLSQGTDLINIHCDLIDQSMVDGQETDIIYTSKWLEPGVHFTVKCLVAKPLNRGDAEVKDPEQCKDKEKMATLVYSKEQLNYFRVCHIVTNILPEGLRSIFKHEWDRLYQATLGEWKDTPCDGQHFYNKETTQSRKNRLMPKVREGNRAQWDCTTLFFAILRCDSIGRKLCATVNCSLEDLNEFRNEKFAHAPWGQLSELEFKLAVQRVKVAFESLDLPTEQVQEISRQESFQTKEIESLKKRHDLYKELEETKVKLETLEKVCQQSKKQLEKSDKERQLVEEQLKISEEQRQQVEEQLEILEEQLEVLEDQLKDDVSPFLILPPEPNHEVATRDGEVAEITEKLDQLKRANQNRLSYLYITGNPGSGKSQLAGLVAEKFYNKVNWKTSSPSFVISLNAESLQTLLESYVTFARQVKCPEYDLMETRWSRETSIEEKITNVKDLIARKIPVFESWLVVVDNGMKPIEARRFLANLTGFQDHEMEDKVAKALDYQPLALASAGTYVSKIRECDWAANFGWKEYLEKLENGMRALTEEVLRKTNPAYSKSMTVATRLAVERAINNDGLVKNSFILLSLCAPEALHLDIVKNYVSNVDEHADKEGVAIQIQGYSLLLVEKRNNGVFIGMHRVVRDAITSELSHKEPHECAQTVCAAVKSFNQFVEAQPLNTWYAIDSVSESKHLISHLKALAIKVEQVFKEECRIFRVGVLNVSDWSSCFHRFGIICENHCELSCAENYYRTALKLVEPVCDTVANSARIYQRLGKLRRSMGDLKEAIEFLGLSIAIYVEKLGPEDINVAISHHNLGNALLELVDLKQASEHFQLALEICKKKCGTDHVLVASIYHSLGIAQREMGNLQQALTHFDDAVTIYEKICETDHADVAPTYLNLGMVQRELGNLQQATKFLDRALDIFKIEPGSGHVNVAHTYLNLGIVHREFGNLKQAKEYLDLSLIIFKTELGNRHVNVAHTYLSLGIVQCEFDNLQQAKEYLDGALDIFKTEPGSRLVNVAHTYLNLGIVQRELGELQLAMESLHCALNIFTKDLGPDHVEVASCYEDLGNIQRALGNLPRARKLCTDALEIKQRSLGPEHIAVARTYVNLSDLLYDMHHYKQAKEHCQHALEIYNRGLRSEHVDVARTHQNLGKVQCKLGDLKQAKERFEHALGIYKRRIGSEHVEVARTYQGLGKVHHELGDLQQAKECFEHALGIYKRKPGSRHVDLALTYIGLAYVYDWLDDQEQTSECTELVKDICKRGLGSEHVDVGFIYKFLGKAYYNLRDLQRAKKCFEHALGIYKRIIGSEHVDVAKTYEGLGKVHYMLGDLKQAKEHLERALGIYSRRIGPKDVKVARTCQSLGEVYCSIANLHQARNNLTQAKKLFEHALTINKEKLGPEHANTVNNEHSLVSVQEILEKKGKCSVQ
ncbi:Nephrocystin-3 [Stylophora pistillata]|uniref:Nephrocystin-3 n=2 Tax=Stylophora pistillata TaxID=50429 RepID=A0A2B4RUN7_STYPI|nr:Nephrocystin-3 [Stylophora pistillata]